jgi:hypothetical protein
VSKEAWWITQQCSVYIFRILGNCIYGFNGEGVQGVEEYCPLLVDVLFTSWLLIQCSNSLLMMTMMILMKTNLGGVLSVNEARRCRIFRKDPIAKTSYYYYIAGSIRV